MSDSTFWDKAHAAAAKATWAYLATADGNQPRVRVVHPAFEGERVWVATGRTSAKARHIAKNPRVELFYQIGAEMIVVRRARSGGGSHDDLALGSTLRSRTGAAAAPSSQADEQILACR